MPSLTDTDSLIIFAIQPSQLTRSTLSHRNPLRSFAMRSVETSESDPKSKAEKEASDKRKKKRAEEKEMLKNMVDREAGWEVKELDISQFHGQFVSVSTNPVILIWDIYTQQPRALCSLVSHTSDISSLTFLEPYPAILSGDMGGTFIIWGTFPSNMAGRILYRFDNKSVAMPSTSCSPTSASWEKEAGLVTGDVEGVVKVWDIKGCMEDRGVQSLKRPRLGSQLFDTSTFQGLGGGEGGEGLEDSWNSSSDSETDSSRSLYGSEGEDDGGTDEDDGSAVAGATFKLTGLDVSKGGKSKGETQKVRKRDAVVLRYWKSGNDSIKKVRIIESKLLDVLQWGHKFQTRQRREGGGKAEATMVGEDGGHLRHNNQDQPGLESGERRPHEFPPGVFEPIEDSLYFHLPNHLIVTIGFSFMTSLWAMDGGRLGGLRQGALVNTSYGREASSTYRIRISETARNVYKGAGALALAGVQRKKSRLNSFFEER
jgi:hypothetical protein